MCRRHRARDDAVSLDWTGGTRALHPHVVAALALGPIIASLPIAVVLFRSGTAGTRHVVAVAQMLELARLEPTLTTLANEAGR